MRKQTAPGSSEERVSVLEEIDFEPVRVLEIEIENPLSSIPANDEQTGRHYGRALVLVRLHTRTIGLIELDLGEAGLSAEECAHHIWETLGEEINLHLRLDGLPEVKRLDAGGLPVDHTPHCVEDRERVLHEASPVTIIIGTRDRPDTLKGTLDSLLALDYPSYDIIVVDNAPSTTATWDLVRERYSDVAQIRYLREDRPGVSHARNRGLEEVKTSLVAFTDDDLVVDQYWLVELVKAFDAADDIGAVTGLVFAGELETPSELWFEQATGWSSRQGRTVYDLANNRPPSPFYPYSCGMIGTGANHAFRADVLREIGGFDPALGPGSPALGGEDLALYFEVLAAGHRIVYEPSAIVRHWHRSGYEALRKQMFAYGSGLTANLTRVLLKKPSRVIDFGLRVPAGLVYALRSDASLVSRPSSFFPKELTTLERRGLFNGPFGYLKGRYRLLKAGSKR